MKTFFALLLLPVVLGVKRLCPGGSQRCPDSSTCCILLNKSYGCCPLEDAVCCDDHIHCCPSNTKCSAGMCVEKGNTSTSLHSITSNDIVCPDGEVTCPDETTCCKSPPGRLPKYGCCPMPDAVCCDDGDHCCPAGTTCDVKEGKCLGDGFVTEMYRKKTLHPKAEMVTLSVSSKPITSVVCPGSGFQCPDLYTCCKTVTGDWGCCPFPNAQCCKDGIHCCPENMHCDATSQYCSQGVTNTMSLPKVPAKEILQISENICPDKTQCGMNDTCCKGPREKYGCCPYINATCCSDHLHCCPIGSRCNVKGRMCIFLNNQMSNDIDDFHEL